MHEAILVNGELPSLRRPIMVAAFWGFGDGTGTAIGALRHIRTLGNAPEVATVDPDRFYDFSVARPRRIIEDGEPILRWPGTRFYVVHAERRDIVILAGRDSGYVPIDGDQSGAGGQASEQCPAVSAAAIGRIDVDAANVICVVEILAIGGLGYH